MESHQSLLYDLRRSISRRDRQEIGKILKEGSTLDLVHDIMMLRVEEREQLFQLVDPVEAAQVLRAIPHVGATDVVSQLPPENAARLLRLLDVHGQADILRKIDHSGTEQILEQMERKDVRQLRQIQRYPENTAGGMMSTETLTFRRGDTVGEALKILVKMKEDRDSQFKFYPYVVDRNGVLIGVVSVLSLLGEPNDRTVDEIMVKATSIRARRSLEELHVLFEETGYFSLPVVNRNDVLIGTVYHEDVAERMLDEAESDALKAHGVISEELRTMPLLLRSRRRLAWLSANIVLNIIAASVISAYEQTLSAVIAIAVFLPMVSDMSGCSGNQAVAVSMRELALGLARPADAFRVWLKEVSVGVINGTVLGILIGVVAWLWKGNPYLGLVIGTALTLNTLIAVSIGGTVPLILKRFKVDPAVASGPLLTTVTDMAGFFLVLSLAQLMMPLLIQ
ncbi:MAG: magnesium transporter [Magnetococcales bacterium]|nr:magnesium transporter [Magnetococcales bacterium]